MESVGIKESKEVLEGLKLVGVCVAKISADGKVDLSDAVHAVELVKESDKLVAAVKGADKALPELKDLSQAELIELGSAAYGMVKEIMAARKA